MPAMTIPYDSPAATPPSYGAFVTGLAGAALSALTLAAVPFGFPFSMRTMSPVLYVYIPSMIVSFMLAGTSMGWIFVSFGRTKRYPRWLAATAVLIVLTILELFALTYISSLHQPPVPT